MARMGDIEREAAEAVAHWLHQRHDRHDQDQLLPQETHMSRISDARNVISALADNPLIEQLAELGLGRKLQGHEIETVVNFVAGLEYPRTPVQAPPQQDGAVAPQPVA